MGSEWVNTGGNFWRRNVNERISLHAWFSVGRRQVARWQWHISDAGDPSVHSLAYGVTTGAAAAMMLADRAWDGLKEKA